MGAEVMGKTRESLEVDQLIAAETDAEKEAQRLQPIIASPPATDLRDPTRLRKDQWKSAFGKLHPIFAQAGVVQMKKVEFVEICGDPVKTQSVGDTAFWYYQCKDGTIQFELDKGNLLAGMVAGKVNDF